MCPGRLPDRSRNQFHEDLRQHGNQQQTARIPVISAAGLTTTKIYHMTSPSTINCRWLDQFSDRRSALRDEMAASSHTSLATSRPERPDRREARQPAARLADPAPAKIDAVMQNLPGMGLTASSHADYCTIRLSEVAYQGSWAPPATGSQQSTEARRRCAKALFETNLKSPCSRSW